MNIMLKLCKVAPKWLSSTGLYTNGRLKNSIIPNVFPCIKAEALFQMLILDFHLKNIEEVIVYA